MWEFYLHLLRGRLPARYMDVRAAVTGSETGRHRGNDRAWPIYPRSGFMPTFVLSNDLAQRRRTVDARQHSAIAVSHSCECGS